MPGLSGMDGPPRYTWAPLDYEDRTRMLNVALAWKEKTELV